MVPVNLVFEDVLSEFVMQKMLCHFENKFYIAHSYNGAGFGYIRNNINGFNQGALAMPFFVLTDLDRHECPISLIRNWLNSLPNPNLIFRVAVREVESWLLADKRGLAHFLGVSAARIPSEPDGLEDPKRTLINIARRSRKRDIREDILPINENARIGPNYNGKLMEYVLESWDIMSAMQSSDSLARAMRYLERFDYVQPQ